MSTEQIIDHYASGYEAERLITGAGQLERERTRELLLRFLPPAPATVLDIGGGTGTYACWLAKLGYEVHLTDITPLHVEMAIAASREQPEAPIATVSVGDARSLSFMDSTANAVLLLGPLYHLTQREDRLSALREAHRVLRTGGILIAVGVSRFASTMDGVRAGFLKDPDFMSIVMQDLKNGHHVNPTDNPMYFMETFFHHPDELREEVTNAGFTVARVLGIEGPGWIAGDFAEWWGNPEYRERLLLIARAVEVEPTLLGISAHLLIVATKTA